jgi:hypothetical protein
MADAQQPDVMKRLVLFIVGMAIVGLIMACIVYFAFYLPAMQAAALQPPLKPTLMKGPWSVDSETWAPNNPRYQFLHF